MRAEPPSDADRREGERDGVPPGAPAWVTRELVQRTIGVWQPYYKDLLTADDALAIIQSVGRLCQALAQR